MKESADADECAAQRLESDISDVTSCVVFTKKLRALGARSRAHRSAKAAQLSQKACDEAETKHAQATKKLYDFVSSPGTIV
jgi:hypothetical protein